MPFQKGHKMVRGERIKRSKTCHTAWKTDQGCVQMMKAVYEDAKSKAGLFERVYSGKASLREAIKANCLHCTWMDIKAITECTAMRCPLWLHRPYQTESEHNNEQ